MTHYLYKLIIADDEEAIRRGLSNFGKWEELGYEIAAVYEDGSEIIQHLEKGLEVDVILSDIVMNECSGLDVLRYINKNNINVKTILLSGYSDFEIAQEAISLGASEYLLKPTVLSELRKAFTKIKNELDDQRAIQKTREMQKLWLEKILVYIICNPSHIDINELWDVIGIKSSHKDFYWVNISIEINEKFSGNNSEIEVLLKNSLDFEKEWIVVTNAFINTIKILVLIPKDLSMDFYKDLIQEKVARSVNALTELFDYDLVLSQVTIANDWSEMQLLTDYKNMNNYIKEIGTIYTSETLFAAIKNYDYKKIKDFLTFAKDNTAQVYTLLIRVAMTLYLQLENYHVVMENQLNVNNIKKILYQDNNANMIIQYSYNAIVSLEKFLGNRKQIISKMCEYIDLHVAEGITLQDMADYFNYNASYLSRIFKESTGVSFSSYVKKIKVQHAKAMLNNPKLKIYEISEKLGYNDVRHFYKVFKDTTKMTPTKYRERESIDID